MRTSGTGTITKKGYVRLSVDNKDEFAHRKIWKDSYGEIPEGMSIHHIDGDRQNNSISNLTLVDSLTHKRIHCGYENKNGEWFKACRKCGEKKDVKSGFYTTKKGTLSWCRRCFVEYATERRKKLAMLMIVFFILVGCGGRLAFQAPVVIEQPPKYCPAPLRPTLVDPKSMPVLLDDYLTVVEYALELEETIQCYEGKDEVK